MAMKFTFLFLDLAKIHIFSPKGTEGGGPPVKEIFLKKKIFTSSPNLAMEWVMDPPGTTRTELELPFQRPKRPPKM